MEFLIALCLDLVLAFFAALLTVLFVPTVVFWVAWLIWFIIIAIGIIVVKSDGGGTSFDLDDWF